MKNCNQCKTAKRYVNLSFCYKCYRLREKEKREEKALKKKERYQKSKKYQESEYKKLSKKAWKVFSLYIRKKYPGFNDYAACYTCGNLKPRTELQAGHCFHRGRQRYKAIDFDEKHIRPQCSQCNFFRGGRNIEFTLKLVEEHGLEAVNEMKRRRDTEPPLTNKQLQEIINKYK